MNFTILLSTGEIHTIEGFTGRFEINDGALIINTAEDIAIAVYPKGVWLYFIQNDKVKSSK